MKKRKSALSREPTWDQIGKAIGMKMEKKYKEEECKPWKAKEHIRCHGTGGAIYGLGFIGALIYYIATAPSFWMGVLGILKAIVWPAFLVHGVLKFLGM